MKTLMVMTGFLAVAAWTAVRGQENRTEPHPPAAVAEGAGERNIRLNFRGVPLDMVLNHLSEAAGFIVMMETEVKGQVDVWSNQPLNRDEAVEVLNTILNRNGYAAIRNGRTLRIVSRDEAKTQNLPVHSGANPDVIPQSDKMVTQIIPIRYANATQMTRDLQPLLPSYATLTANESGNALVLTDTQSNVRRVAEIVQALDTSISSISTIRVFPLRYSDAKELATSVKELFEPPSTQGRNNNDRRAQFFAQFGGGPDGGRRGGEPSAGTGDSQALKAASRVVAVADERTNSLVVSAPDEYMPVIEQLVTEIDVVVDDITELRVFPLVNADPVELSEMFRTLFPDETTQNNGRTGGFRFGRGGFGGGGQSSAATSERAKKQGRVVTVPDPRTSSIIVSAASELMPQIEEMIARLDASPARKQKVYVYSLENADVTQVEQVLRNMFERNSTQLNRNRQNQTSALDNRSRQTQTGTGIGVGAGQGTGAGGGTGNRPGQLR